MSLRSMDQQKFDPAVFWIVVGCIAYAMLFFYVGDSRGFSRAVDKFGVRSDTTYVLPEPMEVGEVLGLKCFIMPREES